MGASQTGRIKTASNVPPPRAKQMFQHGHRNQHQTGMAALSGGRTKQVQTYSTKPMK